MTPSLERLPVPDRTRCTPYWTAAGCPSPDAHPSPAELRHQLDAGRRPDAEPHRCPVHLATINAGARRCALEYHHTGAHDWRPQPVCGRRLPAPRAQYRCSLPVTHYGPHSSLSPESAD